MTAGNAPNKEHDDMSERLPRGIRNNNPGNLDYVGQPGAHLETGVPCPRFAAFPTMADGIRALRDQLLRYGERGLTTVRAIISVYAPASENPTGAYVYALCSHMGVQPDTVLDLRDPAIQRSLIAGITTMENGPGHLSPDQIAQALQATPAVPHPVSEA
ncbi:bacteriophage protein [Komagataeibacter diospyri]|uniref:Bacteriophage protein n=2 Tax=Komagataeibacter diospyri TaxID=1932662 RepID=A0A4P5NN59_9PROT|nr:bacteriophage protein [Komagataeibacter diospyri]